MLQKPDGDASSTVERLRQAEVLKQSSMSMEHEELPHWAGLAVGRGVGLGGRGLHPWEAEKGPCLIRDDLQQVQVLATNEMLESDTDGKLEMRLRWNEVAVSMEGRKTMRRWPESRPSLCWGLQKGG